MTQVVDRRVGAASDVEVARLDVHAFEIPVDGTGRQGVRRDARVGLDDGRRRRGARGRRGRRRLHVRASGRRRCSSTRSSAPRSRARARSTSAPPGSGWPSRSATSAGPASGFMAIAAVDVALWDLKAKLLGLPLDGRARRLSRRGAGLRLRRLLQLPARAPCRAARGLGRAGDPAREAEDLAAPGGGPAAARCRARGGRRRHGDPRRRERRPHAQGRAPLGRALPRGVGRRLVRGAGHLRRPRRPAPAARPRPRRARRRRRRVRLRRRGRPQPARAGASTACSSTSPAAAGSRRCATWPGSPTATGSRSRRTARRRSRRTPSARRGGIRHLEYFHDHVRVERMLFDGVLEPTADGTLAPDRSRPGPRARAALRRRRAVPRLREGDRADERPDPRARRPPLQGRDGRDDGDRPPRPRRPG